MMFRSLFSSSAFFYRRLTSLNPSLNKISNLSDMSNSTLSKNFQKAIELAKTLKQDPGNEAKLKLYAFYKQSTEGPCKTPKPTGFDFVGKAKWQAWNALESMSQNEAKQKYIALVNELSDTNSKVDAEKLESYTDIDYTVENGITKITFNRPEKKNAITVQMYKDIIDALKRANEGETSITVITGKGEFYSSGNDLSNFTSVEGDLAVAAKQAANMLREFVAAFIDFRKILVAAVNGPAVGIPVTLLGLCDIVYASDKATFQTPFSKLGQSPEGCSTYTFPKIMGYSRANEILLFNKKFTAMEAKEAGLVSEIFPHDTFMQNVNKKLSMLAEFSSQSMIITKELYRQNEKAILHQVNTTECEYLVERWQSPDCMEALLKFFQRKGKL